MEIKHLKIWFSWEKQEQMIECLVGRVGLTRVRATCFLRLWIYAIAKEGQAKPPLSQLIFPTTAIICTHRQASDLFYQDQDQGSERSAGMMLDKLAALGLIEKIFDGNTTRIKIKPITGILEPDSSESSVELQLDQFNPRCDAIPVANLLTRNYNWMNRNAEAIPHRISRLLRGWAKDYTTGMRVLRRVDNLNPVGFYLLYPTANESEANFFTSPNKSLHLSAINEQDPFKMASVGDENCLSVFIRSWMIDANYLEKYRLIFLQDAQKTLQRMTLDFPNLCDLHTLIIHPDYEKLAAALGFQKTIQESPNSIYWMYLGLDRFLSLDMSAIQF
ncbi:MAG: hypothetical protein PX636_10945 [Microcystis sp. M53598_WE2]|uniref:hypothetical protein n=1 Tax=Microcystis sp. M53598_WE2 TaxID=3030677 RepID=UPI00258C53F6|nr:hypothetical protein [Microcystis sp. M53598_WE2]MDJ0671479.1 hypothetical protein [Microcystis sp. M53598_WE2]